MYCLVFSLFFLFIGSSNLLPAMLQQPAQLSTEELTLLVAKAWEHAGADNNAEAQYCFWRAAEAGSWEAANFLASDYATGDLFGSIYAGLAQQYTKRSEQIVAKHPDQCFYDYALEKKIVKVKVSRFIKKNDWYKSIFEVLYEQRMLVMPEQGVALLYRIIIEKDGVSEETAQKYLQLLCAGIRQCGSGGICQAVFDALHWKDGVSIITDTINLEIVENLFSAWAGTLNDDQESMKKFSQACVKLFEKYCVAYQYCPHDPIRMQMVIRTQIADWIISFFGKYAGYARTEFIANVCYLLDYPSSNYFFMFKEFWKFLGLLNEKERSVCIQKIVGSNRFPGFIEELFAHPAEVDALCRAGFDKNALLKRLFTCDQKPLPATAKFAFISNALRDVYRLLFQRSNSSNLSGILSKENRIQALVSAFKHGDASFYITYKDDIEKILPEFLQQNMHEYSAVFHLMQRVSDPTLKKFIIQLLVRFSATHIVEASFQHGIIKCFFRHDSLTSEELLFAYRYMDAVYQEKNKIIELQVLWNGLNTCEMQDDPKIKNLLFNSVMSYYQVSPLNLGISSDEALLKMPFAKFLNAVLTVALDKKTISLAKIYTSLRVAGATGLNTYIRAGMVEQQLVFDAEVPFAERAAFIDRRLSAMDFISLMIFCDRLQQDLSASGDLELQVYIANIHKALDSANSSFERCKAKKELKNMHLKYRLPNNIPRVVIAYSGDLPNYLALPCANPVDYILTSREFTNVHIGNGNLLYGFQNLNEPDGHWIYRFGACDAQSLDLVWEVSFGGRKMTPYAIGTHVYLAQDDKIFVFDKNTGVELSSFSMGNGLPIEFIGICSSGLLCIVQKGVIAFLNADTGSLFRKNMVVKLWNDSGDTFCVAGNALVCRYADSPIITLYTLDEQKSVIQWTDIDVAFSQQRDWYFFRMTAKDDLLYFKKQLEDGSYQLVCFDTVSAKPLWTHPLPKNLSQKPCFSLDGKRLFFVMPDGKIVALITDNSFWFTRVLWQIESPHEFGCALDQLAVSPDGLVLYGGIDGRLYKINAETGSCALAATQPSASAKLIGVSKAGLPFVQSIS